MSAEPLVGGSSNVLEMPLCAAIKTQGAGTVDELRFVS